MTCPISKAPASTSGLAATNESRVMPSLEEMRKKVSPLTMVYVLDTPALAETQVAVPAAVRQLWLSTSASHTSVGTIKT